MVYKRQPEGTAITHFQEYRAASALAWKWRASLQRYRWDIADVRSEIMLHILNKKHLFDPVKGAYSTWCWTLARRYLGRKVQFAKTCQRRLSLWLPASDESQPTSWKEQAELLCCLFRTTPMLKRHRRVLFMWLRGKTLADVSTRFGFSRARAGQLLAKAMKKVRARMDQMASDAKCASDELFLGAA